MAFESDDMPMAMPNRLGCVGAKVFWFFFSKKNGFLRALGWRRGWDSNPRYA